MDAQARMIADQIEARGVTDGRVLSALRKVPRERFVPGDLRGAACADRPLPIGFGQTISQPYIVAYMTEALKLEPTHRVLEIGTGSGYQTALLAELAAQVYSIEVVEALAACARQTLDGLGYRNLHIRVGDGYAGWPDEAPFDRIIAAAAAPEMPPALVQQLAEGGILVIPVGTDLQELRVLRKERNRMELLSTLAVRFVPMIPTPKASRQE
ncbi:MAG: protein-L-isoaspartate(D-aspartate) O-methyltransferase [Vicinamibacterales bacterium]